MGSAGKVEIKSENAFPLPITADLDPDYEHRICARSGKQILSVRWHLFSRKSECLSTAHVKRCQLTEAARDTFIS